MNRYAVVASLGLALLSGMNVAIAKDALVQFDDLVVPDAEIESKWCRELPSGMWECCGNFDNKKVSTCEITWGKSEL